MLAVKSVLDHEAILVEVVQNFVSILWHGGGEDYDLVVESHISEELDSSWSDQIIVTIDVVHLVVNQGLIQIEDKCVNFRLVNHRRIDWWQIRNRYLLSQKSQLSIDLILLVINHVTGGACGTIGVFKDLLLFILLI